MGATLTAIYCDGWDDAVVNPLTREIAASRHAAGEPYSVVLLAGGRPHAVLDIALAEGHVGLTRFRAFRHEWRKTREGDLFLREARFLRGTATRTVSFQLNGRRTDRVEEPNSSSTDFTDNSPPPRTPVPPFGEWQPLLEFAGDGRPEIANAELAHFQSADPSRAGAGIAAAEAGDALRGVPVRSGVRPWEPPRPLRPGAIDALFTDGAEFAVGGRIMRISTHDAGPLHLPSGRVVAADPSSLEFGEEPFTVTVAGGVYPVTISLATFADDASHVRVAAARLRSSDLPVVSWELALRAGQDELDLGAGEFFGFGVDGGMGCFVDEDNRERLADAWERFDFRTFTSVGSELVAWSSGWGDGAYPTWIGRDKAGNVGCFVADMRLFGV